MLLGSLVLTAMVVILTPISLPQDIQQQTISRSSPSRCAAGADLGPDPRVHGAGDGPAAGLRRRQPAVPAPDRRRHDRRGRGRGAAGAPAGPGDQGRRAPGAGRPDEDADVGRFPVLGSLLFVDSRGKLSVKGIDVGQEMVLRSHIEGATQAKAIWRYGLVQDPFDLLMPNPRA
jgi:hypothetical protein